MIVAPDETRSHIVSCKELVRFKEHTCMTYNVEDKLCQSLAGLLEALASVRLLPRSKRPVSRVMSLSTGVVLAILVGAGDKVCDGHSNNLAVRVAEDWISAEMKDDGFDPIWAEREVGQGVGLRHGNERGRIERGKRW